MNKLLYVVPESELIELKPDGIILGGSELDASGVEGLIGVEGEWIL